jgi:type I restriction enzyme M protein
VGARAADEFDFVERLEGLAEELEVLNVEAQELQVRISDSLPSLLESAR